MKKILYISVLLVLCLSFFSCSDSGSSSSLTDQERSVIMSAAFTGALSSVASADPTRSRVPAPTTYTSPDGTVTVEGSLIDIQTGTYSLTVTFNNYSDSDVTLSGSMSFGLNGVNFFMNGSFTAVYQGSSYSFSMDITGSGSDSLTGTVTIDGTSYAL